MTCNITSRPPSLQLSLPFLAIQDRKKRHQFRFSSLSGPSYVQFGYLALLAPSIPGMSCPFYYISSLAHFFFFLSSSVRTNLSLLSPLSIALCLPRPLLQQSPLPLAQLRGLSVVHALQPVSEARSAERIDGVRPQGGAVEEGAHLDADLPEAHGEACRKLASKRDFAPGGGGNEPKQLQKAMRWTMMDGVEIRICVERRRD